MKLLVVALRLEADHIISMTLRDPDRSRLPAWEPGAHVAITLPSGKVRQYSLCGDRNDPCTYTVAILKVAQGRGGSREIHEQVRIGDLLTVGEPRNDFVLEPAPYYLFLAGGIGVTPIVAMVESLRSAGHLEYQVVYGARTRAAMAFIDRLQGGDGARVQLVAQDEAGTVDIAAAMAASPPGTRVYCCGPPAMLAAVQDTATRFPGLGVHLERFAAAPREQPAGTETSFEVELARTGVTVTVGPDVTVLDAVLEVAPDTPYSCTAGFCGTCETKVLAGQVDHRDELLTEDERAANTSMMICVSRVAGGTKLTLDL
ncbi:iron-sulfur protein [Mycobacterium sp. djl-10]|nr:iron-sulfur protein [Mycobacterium sp. djl-10]